MGCGSSKAQVAPVVRSNKPECFIIGPPGSVKGRICELLEKPKDEGGLGIRHLSLGEAHRTCVRKNDALGPRVKEALQVKFNKDQEARKSGERPDPANGPDPDLNAQVLSWMFKEEAKEGWMLEGYPRTQAEADALKKHGVLVEKLVIVNISDNDLMDIATGRRMDLITNTMYHLQGLGGWDKPPDDEQVQARLVQRQDDAREKVLARLSEYKETYLNVETFFEKSGVKKVDGRRPPDEIAQELLLWLQIEGEPAKEERAAEVPPLVADPVEDLEAGGGRGEEEGREEGDGAERDLPAAAPKDEGGGGEEEDAGGEEGGERPGEEEAEQPKEDAEQPKEDAEQPKEVEEQPKEEEEQPKEEEEQPKEEVEQPNEEVEQPKDNTEQPKEEAVQSKEDAKQPEKEEEQPKEEAADKVDEEVPEENIEEEKIDEEVPEEKKEEKLGEGGGEQES